MVEDLKNNRTSSSKTSSSMSLVAMFVLLLSATSVSAQTTIDGVIYDLHVETQEARVIGYDNPEKVVINSTISHDSIEYWIIGIDDGAFRGATTLKSVDLSEASALRDIGKAVFADCTNLEEVIFPAELPNDLNAITDSMFCGCSALSTIQIPGNVSFIGEYAFYNCSSLEKIFLYSYDPPALIENTFSDDIFEKASLYVADVSMYMDAAFWCSFKIYPIPVVLPSEVLIITLDQDSYTYTGSEIKPDITVKRIIDEEEIAIDADEYIVSYTDNINAGTATVIVTDNEGGEFLILGSASVTFQIDKAKGQLDQLLDQAPKAQEGIVYNGSDQDLITAGSTKKGTLKYSLDGNSFDPDITKIKGTNAGTYTVYYMVEGDSNYTASDTLSLAVTIAPKEITTFTLSDTSYTYDGGEHKPGVTVTDGETTISADQYTVSYTDNINAGTATVTLTDNEGGNYNVYGSTTFSIAQAALTISAGYYELFEGEAIPEFTLNYDGFMNNETEAVLTTKPTVSCKATTNSKAGEYIISVSGAEAANYSIEHKNGKLVILGLKFESGGNASGNGDDVATYQITNKESNGATPPTVSINDAKEVSGKFEIPESVVYHDKAFIVTEIGEGAFENNKYLTEVIIPSSISGIGDKAFKGCSNLEAIAVYIVTPINLSVAKSRGNATRGDDGSSVFEGVNKETCVLYVPDGSIELYKAAPIWNEFKHIASTTGINGITMGDEKRFDVYNMQGQKVKSRAIDLNGLPRGVYIINGKKLINTNK